MRTLAYVSIRQHTSAYVSIRQHTSVMHQVYLKESKKYLKESKDADVGIVGSERCYLRPHTSAYVSIRQHTSAYVSIHKLKVARVITIRFVEPDA
jgi:hypothetical protein